jgi:glycosyltransferase involved in cell wall biosynthesis
MRSRITLVRRALAKLVESNAEATNTRRIGIYLGLGPEAGGAYQYSLTVAQSIARLAKSGWELVAFARGPNWKHMLPAEFQVVQIARAPLLSRAVLASIDRLGLLATMSRLLDPWRAEVRIVNQSACDIVLFPGQDPTAYRIQAPALVAVHDLMHRYERQQPEYAGNEYWRRERHYKRIAATALGILVDSAVGKAQFLESYGVEEQRVHVLPFAPPEYLAASPVVDVAKKYALPKDFFFYPAQMWEHKNHPRLIEAIHILKSRGICAALVLVGSRKSGWKIVEHKIRDLGVENEVRCLGYVPLEEMASFYRAALATVFVSLLGPTNIPPLEAMSMGSPLIVSNVYGMPAQVGDAALQVDPRNPAAIASAMEILWTDPQLRKELSEKGLRRSQTWTTHDFATALTSIVSSLSTPRQ